MGIKLLYCGPLLWYCTALFLRSRRSYICNLLDRRQLIRVCTDCTSVHYDSIEYMNFNWCWHYLHYYHYSLFSIHRRNVTTSNKWFDCVKFIIFSFKILLCFCSTFQTFCQKACLCIYSKQYSTQWKEWRQIRYKILKLIVWTLMCK